MSIKVKALEWVENHGVAGYGPYRLFEASTPAGRFSYGTDSEGSPWWCAQYGGIFMVGDEEKAKRLAEAAWSKTALDEAAKFVEPSPEPDMSEAVKALILAGNDLANCAYNLSQEERLTNADRRTLRLSQVAWDDARRALTGAKP